MSDPRLQPIFDTHFAARAQELHGVGNRWFVRALKVVLIGLVIPLNAGALGLALLDERERLGPLVWVTLVALAGVAAAAVYVASRLARGVNTESASLHARYHTELIVPAIWQLRPRWTVERASTLRDVDVFLSRLFNERRINRFRAGLVIRGIAGRVPFEIHEAVITGEGRSSGSGDGRHSSFMGIFLDGVFVRFTLPARVPGHLRFVRHHESWRRPDDEGLVSLDAQFPSLATRYVVHGTPDAPDAARVATLAEGLDQLAASQWTLDLAIAGDTAWAVIDLPKRLFALRSVHPFSAHDLEWMDRLFSVVESLAQRLERVR